MSDHDNGFVQVHIIAFSTMFQGFSMTLRLAVLIAFLGSWVMAGSAWAYKVEKICENIPATSKEPAYKKCRVVKVQEDAAAAKADGKGDGKGDGKSAPKADAKK
jgi:prepilin signal peptidase PulO-like enzyme (type II secretory pathway)